VSISAGIAAGMIISRQTPIYPADAKEAGISGTVVLGAIIGTDGTVNELHVVSGPEQLRQAALDAVTQWRYRPYLLNGDPVEVRTTINIIFTLAR
jgi:protein TonB